MNGEDRCDDCGHKREHHSKEWGYSGVCYGGFAEKEPPCNCHRFREKGPSRSLLPCPFCGSVALENLNGGFVRCIDCGCEGPHRGGEDALKLWCRRKPPRAERPVHWQRAPNGMARRCDAFDGGEALDPVSLNVGAVTCVPCLRAANRWAAEQLLCAPGPDFDNPTENPRADENPRSGTSVQCGPLTLNIPPGYEFSQNRHTLIVRSGDRKAAWSFGPVTEEQVDGPAFSFST